MLRLFVFFIYFQKVIFFSFYFKIMFFFVFIFKNRWCCWHSGLISHLLRKTDSFFHVSSHLISVTWFEATHTHSSSSSCAFFCIRYSGTHLTSTSAIDEFVCSGTSLLIFIRTADNPPEQQNWQQTSFEISVLFFLFIYFCIR